MSALVLRLGGPAQSWGGHSIFQDTHPTETVPTRSALLGLVAASLGFARGQWPDWLFDTKFTVRVDSPGALRTDFHTISAMPERLSTHLARSLTILTGKKVADGRSVTRYIMQSNGKDKWASATSVSHREFLSGAEFIVAIEHPDRFDEIAAAVRRPHFTTYFGRKMFAPTFPFYLGVWERSGEEALASLPVAGAPDKVVGCLVHDVDADRTFPRTDALWLNGDTREGQLAWAKENLVR